jgi:hypothetical protein
MKVRVTRRRRRARAPLAHALHGSLIRRKPCALSELDSRVVKDTHGNLLLAHVVQSQMPKVSNDGARVVAASG